ncbi:MAG: DUF427 domain-containing protein [Mycobacterium sp.]
MSERPIPEPREPREPPAAHPIRIEPTGTRITVHINAEVVAQTEFALTLREASYPAVQYIPLGDVTAALTRSDTVTYCPYKGDAGYYHLRTDHGETVEDAVWSYEQPVDAVSAIAGHVAFDPRKADVRLEA